MKFCILPPKEGEEFTPQLLYLIGKRFAAWYIPSLRLAGCAYVASGGPHRFSYLQGKREARGGSERHPA